MKPRQWIFVITLVLGLSVAVGALPQHERRDGNGNVTRAANVVMSPAGRPGFPPPLGTRRWLRIQRMTMVCVNVRVSYASNWAKWATLNRIPRRRLFSSHLA